MTEARQTIKFIEEMNHSKDFWSEVKKILPDYKQSIQWLKEEGDYIIGRGR